MHAKRIVPFDEVHLVPVPFDHRANVVIAGTAQDRRSADLITVQVQNRKYGTVALRVEEADSLPGPRKRARFRLTVSYHRGNHQLWVVERRPERVHEHVAEFPPLVNGTRGRDADVAGDAARGRELAEQAPQAGRVHGDLGIDLRVRAFQIHVGYDGRAAVPGPGEEDHVHIVLGDQPVQVRVDEIEAGGRPPVPEQSGLDVLGAERI